jgi:hypothetical protein
MKLVAHTPFRLVAGRPAHPAERPGLRGCPSVTAWILLREGGQPSNDTGVSSD